CLPAPAREGAGAPPPPPPPPPAPGPAAPAASTPPAPPASSPAAAPASPAAAAASPAAAPAAAGTTPGVTATEILIGSHQPLSGPASSYTPISQAAKAYFDSINDQGGVNGRKIVYRIEDDTYQPNNTVTIVKKLVEQDRVF